LLKFFAMQQFNHIIRQFSQHKNCRPAAKQPPFLRQRGEMLRVCRLREQVVLRIEAFDVRRELLRERHVRDLRDVLREIDGGPLYDRGRAVLVRRIAFD